MTSYNATWRATTKHSKGWQDGTHTFRVGSTNFGMSPVYYASGGVFGCSKDYSSPQKAVYGLCEDHACRVVDLWEVKEHDRRVERAP